MSYFSEVYLHEELRGDIFRRSKSIILLLCLLTTALLMSLVSQNFFWAFALSVSLPGYFCIMHVIFRFQGKSRNPHRAGQICMILSCFTAFILSGSFAYLYEITYADYFKQKYQLMWCQPVEVSPMDSYINYFPITYQIFNSNNTSSNEGDNTPIRYGCGCATNQKQQMKMKDVYGFSYSFSDKQNNNKLNRIPYWLCDQIDNIPFDLVSLKQKYLNNKESTIRQCYIHTYSQPSAEQLKQQNVCSESNAFIQITLDNPPFYVSEDFLYFIGFLMISSFGIGLNYPMTFLFLFLRPTIKAKKILVLDTAFKRKVYLCYALKKALIDDWIKKQLDNQGKIVKDKGQEGFKKEGNTKAKMKNNNNAKVQYNQEGQDELKGQQEGQQQQEQQKEITFWRKEIIHDLIEFLYVDSEYHRLAKRKRIFEYRNALYDRPSRFQNQMQQIQQQQQQQIQVVNAEQLNGQDQQIDQEIELGQQQQQQQQQEQEQGFNVDNIQIEINNGQENGNEYDGKNKEKINGDEQDSNNYQDDDDIENDDEENEEKEEEKQEIEKEQEQIEIHQDDRKESQEDKESKLFKYDEEGQEEDVQINSGGLIQDMMINYNKKTKLMNLS